jgi:membrane-associated protein
MLHYLDPKFLIETAGTIGIIAIIFAESGLFFGFFLPGDSLLFTAGLFASQGYLPFIPLLIGCSLAAILGDSVGYAFGKKTGPSIFTREDSFFFHKKHAERARDFYEKHGVRTIILARFVPIIRTFAPIVAGIGGMPYKTFIRWNIIGGLLWTCLALFAGYFLGQVAPGIEKYLDLIIIAIIVVSLIPVIIEIIREKRGKTAKKI